MAIFRKEHLQPEKTELDRFYAELSNTLAGREPTSGMAESFHQSVEDFQKDFTDIDLRQLNRAIAHFKVIVEDLKHVKEKEQKPIHRK